MDNYEPPVPPELKWLVHYDSRSKSRHIGHWHEYLKRAWRGWTYHSAVASLREAATLRAIKENKIRPEKATEDGFKIEDFVDYTFSGPLHTALAWGAQKRVGQRYVYSLDEAELVAKLTNSLGIILRHWSESQDGKALERLIKLVGLNRYIRQVVCLGTGSPLEDLARWQEEQRHELDLAVCHLSLTRHALALAVATILRAGLQREIPLYVQDPLYNDLDRRMREEAHDEMSGFDSSLLKGSGFIQLDSRKHEAFAKITPDTFLIDFSEHPWIRDTWAAACPSPAAIICRPVDTRENEEEAAREDADVFSIAAAEVPGTPPGLTQQHHDAILRDIKRHSPPFWHGTYQKINMNYTGYKAERGWEEENDKDYRERAVSAYSNDRAGPYEPGRGGSLWRLQQGAWEASVRTVLYVRNNVEGNWTV
ncbi:hypothetical protein B0H67DRAFT_150565 [Lasiosphaeris hirsuta]|uniref:SRR1-like domain-containing protein n=1 Tax=Lasiosphaeris hirsuta TaxID=260670 RepID=A0AA40ANZ5_9PEZI|nr:hypothetical protein B0H67DRAFT_150565 [Lasiosphaeris hirsuta]